MMQIKWRIIDEELITKSEALNSLEFKDFYVIFPSGKSEIKRKYLKNLRGKKLKSNFSYNSRDNKYLSVKQLKKLIGKI